MKIRAISPVDDEPGSYRIVVDLSPDEEEAIRRMIGRVVDLRALTGEAFAFADKVRRFLDEG